MKNTITTTAALIMGAVASVTAQDLSSFRLDFDTQLTDSAAFGPIGFNINFAEERLRMDAGGDTIPGTEFYGATAETVLVGNPATVGYGAAPSGTNAIDARSQAILLSFDRPYDLTLFSTTLDNSEAGDFGQSVLFYDINDVLLRSEALDLMTPGLTYTSGALAGVSKIVLPGNAFYDDLNIQGATAVPEPSTVGLLAISLGAAAVLARKMKKSAA